jgi:hypothetical protein
MEKVFVRIKSQPIETTLKVGEIGFIHAYINGADNRSYVVVITETKIDTVPIWSLEPINNIFIENKIEFLKDFIKWNNKHNGIAQPVPLKMADRYIDKLKIFSNVTR